MPGRWIRWWSCHGCAGCSPSWWMTTWPAGGLPDAKKRAEQVRIVCDGYGLVAAQRRRLPEQIVETVICETAHEAIDPGVSTGDAGPLWGFAWRTRSLYWIWRHRALLRRALD